MSDFDRDYESIASRMQGFKIPLESLMQVLLEVEGIQFHSVTGRVKPKADVRKKMQRPDKKRDINDITDMLGVRIITYFPDEIDAVAKLIEREFTVDPENSIDKRSILDPDRFGYLSLHYVLQVNQERSNLPEYRNYKDIRFELQIRSILQHAWAEIEHDLGYKSEATVPSSIRRRFSRLAGLLELADDEFLRIREELARSTSPRRSRVADIQPEIERLLAVPSPVGLPDWDRRWSEVEYMAHVASATQGFVLLDRLLIEIPSTQGRFEPCDLLGPNDELIHVARARNSASFGHLFNQALVSTEILLDSADARGALISAVEHRGRGRILAPSFYPRDVVLAFPSEGGPIVPIQRIPPFSRLTLSRVAEALEERGVTLRLVGIKNAYTGR
jgi:ppGpp synthetase/RelA/SpoT-type nucleotidyltranferase